MRTIEILSTPLAVTNYQGLSAECLRRAQGATPTAIDFTNTHIVTLRRENERFRRLTDHFDLFVPDGMPLIWCLNRQDAGLLDRVYGPTFMRLFLTSAAPSFRHYMLGGSEECGRRLRAHFPQVNFVGGFHGRCSAEGVLEGAGDDEVVSEINRQAPDFIWVGLGTPKQYEWIRRNRNKIARGVILSVGFAFDVNAGMKSDAPLWMQRAGLTWVFRLLSEPRRLASRYLRYNTLFLFHLVRDALSQRRTR